jgi:hypothetical protein
VLRIGFVVVLVITTEVVLTDALCVKGCVFFSMVVTLVVIITLAGRTTAFGTSRPTVGTTVVITVLVVDVGELTEGVIRGDMFVPAVIRGDMMIVVAVETADVTVVTGTL